MRLLTVMNTESFGPYQWYEAPQKKGRERLRENSSSVSHVLTIAHCPQVMPSPPQEDTCEGEQSVSIWRGPSQTVQLSPQFAYGWQ